MPIFNRYLQNPILRPNPHAEWEQLAAFNGSILKDKNVYYLFYRAMAPEAMYKDKRLPLSTIGKAISKDGITFENREQFIKPEHDWEQYGCEDPRITKLDDTYFIFYTAISNYPPNANTIKCAVAISKDLKTIQEKHLVTPFNAKAMTLFPEKINNKYTVLLTVNTDKPPTKIAYAQFENLETMWDPTFWSEWYEHLDEYVLNIKRINSDQVEVGAPPVKTPHGWVLLYSYIKNYFTPDKIFRVEAVLLDLKHPQHIIGRIEEPCLIPQEFYEYNGQVHNIVFPEGALIENNEVKIYYGAADSYCCVATADYHEFMKSFNLNSPEAIKCHKFPNNPLLEPIEEHDWENKAVLNPAAVLLDGTTYLLYRALSENDVSTIGLAVSTDGHYIDERLPEPIYVPRTKWELSESKTGCGCEDPRVTVIDDLIYMCYTAYDGKVPRIAMTAITIGNFLNRKWETWTEPLIISPEDTPDKDGCLFPEKINGKYVFFHRIEPNITIDFIDDLSFSNGKKLEQNEIIYPGSKFWDGVKIGVNTTPIKTKYGWLMFYHGISQIDHHYRVGAMLLDLQDVTKVVARTLYPLMEPEYYFETDGIVNNVVFPCGSVVAHDSIHLYYGGADTVVCGATINLEELLTYLINSTHKKHLEV